jgi:hypothetical protein
MSDDQKPLQKPQPAVHSDKVESALPDRDDEDRNLAPNDPPSKKTDELPVG